MTSLPSDFFHSWRMFQRNPGLTFVAIVALAMGIGFTTMMFSIVHGGTRGLPFEDGNQLVVILQAGPRAGAGTVPTHQFELNRWRDGLESFDSVGAFVLTAVNLSGAGQPPERVSATVVTWDGLALTGVPPLAGRAFNAGDARSGAAPVVLLSAELAAARFGGPTEAVGAELRVNGTVRRVVGVMPAGFGFPLDARLWVPLASDPAAPPDRGPTLQAYGRLRTGATLAAASEELTLDLARLAIDEPDVFDSRTAQVAPFTELETPAEIRRGLQVLVAAVSLVLLVACANVANLLLARAAARSRDTAIRTALGANRRRLIVQQLAESTLLATLAALVGLGLTWAGLKFFAAASASILTAFWVDFRIDGSIVAFASLLGLLAAVAAGLVPALRSSRAGLGPLMQSSSDRAGGVRIGRLGRSLVVVQLTLACGLLVVTTTLVGTAGALRLVENPFPQDEILTAQLSVLPEVVSDPDRRRDLLARLRDAFASEPTFERATAVSVFPGRGAGNWSFTMSDGGDGATTRSTGVAMVTPEFFELADAAPVRGRLFTWQDDTRAPMVAVVNESFVARYLSDRVSPIGRRLRLGLTDDDITVIGVVPDLLLQDVEDTAGDGMYLPMLQQRPYTLRLMATTRGAPIGAAPALRQVVASVDPDLPVYEVGTLREAIFREKSVLDAMAALFLCFGLGTIFLAVLGLHAILSFVITERRREFGVRMALGARAGDLVRLVLRRGGVELLWGLALGLSLAAGLSRLLAAAIEQVPPAGLGVLAMIAAVVTLGALTAIWRPVRQVIRLDPLDALRHE